MWLRDWLAAPRRLLLVVLIVSCTKGGLQAISEMRLPQSRLGHDHQSYCCVDPGWCSLQHVAVLTLQASFRETQQRNIS